MNEKYNDIFDDIRYRLVPKSIITRNEMNATTCSKTRDEMLGVQFDWWMTRATLFDALDRARDRKR